MASVLIIEDEESILMALEDDLQHEGYQVVSAQDGESGLAKAKQYNWDLILLDLMLPKIDGLEVCRQLRHAEITTPIIMLTAKSQELDKVLGLELGADDYITKPFSPRELLARIKALLRRTKPAQQAQTIYRFGAVEVDFQQYETKRDGQPIYLTALEYALLLYFLEHQNQVLSRDTILQAVWGDAVQVYPRTVDTHVAHLRKKIEADPANPQYLVGVRGVGYKCTI